VCAHAVATPNPEGAEVKRSVTRSGLRLVVLAAFVLALVLVPAAIAAKGGNGSSQRGGQGGSGSTSSATLNSSCNPSCAAGSYASFWGSGYDGSQGAAQLYVSGAWTAIPVAADGTVSFTWYMSATGPYDFKVFQKGNGQKLVLKAQLTVTAQ
jgi:hypothetical protein